VSETVRAADWKTDAEKAMASVAETSSVAATATAIAAVTD
jgi:hypothetical protein